MDLPDKSVMKTADAIVVVIVRRLRPAVSFVSVCPQFRVSHCLRNRQFRVSHVYAYNVNIGVNQLHERCFFFIYLITAYAHICTQILHNAFI
jgi:hypothetical protein